MRAAETAARDAARGFETDRRLDGVIRAVQAGRMSHACRLLGSKGVCNDEEAAFVFLSSVQFKTPSADPTALSLEGERLYA